MKIPIKTILACGVFAAFAFVAAPLPAQTKLSQLPTTTTLLDNDEIVVNHTTAGTVVTSKITFAALRAALNSEPALRTLTLTYASTVTADAASGDVFDLTLTGNVTLANPINGVNGRPMKWRVKQDATGGRTVTLGNKFRLPTSASALTWSTTPNATDLLAAIYNAAADKWDIVSFVPGY